MEKVVLPVPMMYADHHVTAVRKVLLAQPGVQDVLASAALRAVQVKFDPAATNATALSDALANAGYPVGEDKTPELPVMPRLGDPAWAKLGVREIYTNRVDIEMSGEFRKY